MDPPEDEHAALLFDLTHHVRDQIFGSDFDLARTQRAGKSARQSAARGRNDVVDGRRMRLDLGHVDAVVLGDRPMSAKKHELALSGQLGRSCRASQTSYLDS